MIGRAKIQHGSLILVTTLDIIPTASQLEGFDKDTWYIFERVAITKDLYTGGGRTFLSVDAATEFRGLIYQQYGQCWGRT